MFPGATGNIDIAAQHSDTSVDDVTGNVKVSQEKGSAKDRADQWRCARGRPAQRSFRGRREGLGPTRRRISGKRQARTHRENRDLQVFAHRHGVLAHRGHARPRFRRTTRRRRSRARLRLTTRSKNIRLEDVSGDVRLQNDNGAVELGMRTLGNVQIDNRNGDIQLSLPDKAGFRLDARTRDGEIQSDFPELKVNNDEHESKASGSVGMPRRTLCSTTNTMASRSARRVPASEAAGAAQSAKAGKALPPPKSKWSRRKTERASLRFQSFKVSTWSAYPGFKP